jgi:hypothetical protein
MAISRPTLLSHLGHLAGDLVPTGSTTAQDLETARLAMAQALAHAQAGPLARPELMARLKAAAPAPLPPGATAADLSSALDLALAETSPAQFLVFRRELPVATGLQPVSLPTWASGRAVDRTLGPFLDSLNRPVWIDLFRVEHQVSLVRSHGAAPFLSLPVLGGGLQGVRLSLGPGSLWFASQLLSIHAPASGYTGLLIKGGTLEFSQPVAITPTEIIVPPGVTCALRVTLAPPAPPTGISPTQPGGDARDALVGYPDEVSLTVHSTNATLLPQGNASLQVYGTTLPMQPAAGAVTYSLQLAALLVPFSTPVGQFSVRSVRSTLLMPAGSAAVSQVAWALPVTLADPASLGPAAGVGALAVLLADGLTASWEGQAKALNLGTCWVAADPLQAALLAAGAKGFGTKEVIPLWSSDGSAPPASQLTITYPAPFPLSFFTQAASSEALLVVAPLAANLDRPLTLEGRRVPLTAAAALIAVYQLGTATYLVVWARLDQPADPRAALAFAAANAVMKTSPAMALLLAGQWTGRSVTSGAAVIEFGLQFLLPTLPDPYAASYAPVGYDQRRATLVGLMLAWIDWTAQPKPPRLRFFLPPNVGLPAMVAPGAAAQPAALAAAGPVDVASRTGGGLILLDVSTNADWLGVQFGNPAGQDAAGTAAAASFFVDENMYLRSPGRSVQLITVPEVQWEPVSTPVPTPDDPTFPTPMTFPDSGGPSTLGVETVTLVPVAPLPALADFLSEYNDPLNHRPAHTRFTLPFGIIAYANLVHPEIYFLGGTEISENRPDFSALSMKGGHQISIQALQSFIKSVQQKGSPSLPGYTAQLRNGFYMGLPSGKSILDNDVDTIFNNYFGPGQLHAQVPVTRIDLSGYGESLFSDWLNPEDAAAVVSEARFDVLVGRTSYEVVQVRSILYPYAIRVVRTITIQRLNNAVLIRQDSGWQAASEGRYSYPDSSSDPSLAPSPYLYTHPGVVLGIRAVTNIRDTGQTIFTTKFNNQMMAVRFDGALDIEGVVKGGGPNGVPATSQLGYVQLSDTQNFGRLDPDEYAEVVQKYGPLGGGVDCQINIGASGQLMRVTQVSIDATQGMGGYEFAVAAWGSPNFAPGGQWSFFKQTSPGAAPQPVGQDLGVPLIRAGATPNPPPVTSPYRFSDPVDLAQPDSPLSDYGILHATGTQRVFFPRPKIEASGPLSQRITSTQVPTLADPYTLATAVGFFPPTANAIPFPSSTWALAIGAGGNYKLELPSATFPVTVGQRTLADASSVRAYADYSAATVTFAIDTSAAETWSFHLANVSIVSTSGLMGEVMRVITNVDGSSNSPTLLNNTKAQMSGALGPVQDVMTFLQGLGFPSPWNVSMTNDLKFKAGIKIPMDDELNKLLPPNGPQFIDTDITVTETIQNPLSEAEFEFGAGVMIPTPFDPLQAVGLVKLNIKLSTDSGTTFTLTLGVGLGVSFELIKDVAKVQAYYVSTEFIIFGDTVFGLGVGAILKGTIDLVIISVDVSVEFKMAILKVTCPDVTIWGAAQVTFAIEITIAFVIDIDFEVQSEFDAKMSGGSCPLPDVL